MPGGASLHVLEPVEELEAHAAPLEHLVERREHDVAHAGLHPPEERAAVGEERAHAPRSACAGGEARPRDVAVLVGEGEVVEAAHEARVERPLATRRSAAATRGSRSRRWRRSRAGRAPGRSALRRAGSRAIRSITCQTRRSSRRSRRAARAAARALPRARRGGGAATAAPSREQLGEPLVDRQPKDVGRLEDRGRARRAGRSGGARPLRSAIGSGPWRRCRPPAALAPVAHAARAERSSSAHAASPTGGGSATTVNGRPLRSSGSPGSPAPGGKLREPGLPAPSGAAIGDADVAAPARTRPASRDAAVRDRGRAPRSTRASAGRRSRRSPSRGGGRAPRCGRRRPRPEAPLPPSRQPSW